VIVIAENDEGQTTIIRKYYQPIIHRLWDIAMPNMINHHTDLLSDAVELSNYKNKDDKFLWGWRVTGTTLIKLTKGKGESIYSRAKLVCPTHNWYVIQVIDRHHYHACGYVTWTNSLSLHHLREVIMHNT
jgi:hypothetical protein